MKSFSSYTVSARLIPSFLCSLPIVLLMYFFMQSPEIKRLSDYLSAITIGGVSAYILFLYFFAHIIRSTSKYYENRYFVNDKGFPTTYLMMFENSKYSKEYKRKYREKLKQVFSWHLIDEEQERINYGEAKKRLDEATRLVIPYVGSGYLTKSYNVWYGFVRNLVGGLVYALLFCAINVWLNYLVVKDTLLFYSSLLLFVLYVLLYVYKKKILQQYAEGYADKLIAEFMNLDKRIKE